jgi:TetR/AcrR family transcriptional repressor of nem operon
MARAREFETEAAVDAAMQLFWERGYEGTSVDDLVTRLGIGRGSLYAAFGSKHALYLRALDRYRCQQMAGALAELDAPGTPLLPTVRRLLEGIAAETLGEAFGDAPAGRPAAPPGCFMVNATTERAACDPGVAARVRDNAGAMAATLERAVRRAQAAGEVPAGRDARALARFLVMAIQGLRVAGAAAPDRATLADMIDVTLAALT